jgi:hypothetical protein
MLSFGFLKNHQFQVFEKKLEGQNWPDPGI